MSVYNNLIDALDTVLAQANMLKPGREASLVRTKIDEGDG